MPELERNGGKIHYEVQGEGSLGVVLSHGFGMSGEVWRDVAAALAERYTVVSYDQRCCGQSGKDFDDVSIESQGDDLVAICDELNLDQVVLNGWSFGGAVVVDAAVKLGARMKGLVLTGGATPRYTQAEGFPYGGMPEDVLGTVEALKANRAEFLKGLYYEGVFVADVGEDVKAWCYEISMQASPAAASSLGALATSDQRSAMASLDCPALILHGDQDGVVPFQIGEFASQTLKHSKLVSMAGCGHGPFLEDAPAYMKELEGFLGELS